MNNTYLSYLKNCSQMGYEIAKTWVGKENTYFYLTDESGYKRRVLAKDMFQAIVNAFHDTNVKSVLPSALGKDEIAIDRSLYGFYAHKEEPFAILDLSKIEIHPETSEEEYNRKKSEFFCHALSDAVCEMDDLYVLPGNGYNAEEADVTNAFLYANNVTNGEPDTFLCQKMTKEQLDYLHCYHSYEVSQGREIWIRGMLELSEAEEFGRKYKSLFEESLDHQFWFNCQYSGRDSLTILKAKEAARKIGSYNEWTYEGFCGLVDYLQDTSDHSFYGKDNPNRLNNDFSISLGRESSMCVYIKTSYKQGYDKKDRKEREDGLENYLEDEFSIVDECDGPFGTEVTYRLWWD